MTELLIRDIFKTWLIGETKRILMKKDEEGREKKKRG